MVGKRWCRERDENHTLGKTSDSRTRKARNLHVRGTEYIDFHVARQYEFMGVPSFVLASVVLVSRGVS